MEFKPIIPPFLTVLAPRGVIGEAESFIGSAFNIPEWVTGPLHLMLYVIYVACMAHPVLIAVGLGFTTTSPYHGSELIIGGPSLAGVLGILGYTLWPVWLNALRRQT